MGGKIWIVLAGCVFILTAADDQKKTSEAIYRDYHLSTIGPSSLAESHFLGRFYLCLEADKRFIAARTPISWSWSGAEFATTKRGSKISIVEDGKNLWTTWPSGRKVKFVVIDKPDRGFHHDSRCNAGLKLKPQVVKPPTR